jgi:hypothetical protein
MADEQQVVVVAAPKNVGIAVLLTILFGPLGMFYSTIWGAVIMLVVSLLLGLVTAGFAVFVTWPICVIWGAIAADRHNKRLAGRR